LLQRDVGDVVLHEDLLARVAAAVVPPDRHVRELLPYELVAPVAERASVNFWMLPLCTSVTELRLRFTAYSMAARTRRIEPVSEMGLMPMPESGRISQPYSSCRKSMRRLTSGVPSCNSLPA